MSQIIYNAGIDTIFNVDILRTELDGSLIDGPINGLLGKAAISVVQSLPRLFSSYAELTRNNRGSLFGQGSKQEPGASLQQARRAGIKFFASCEAVLSETDETPLVWQTRLALLRTIDVQALYTVNDDAAGNALRRVGDTSVTALLKAMQGKQPTFLQIA